MATLDRQIPSPDTFLCEPWSSFVSATKLRFVDKMLVCTHFPALEDFCLVVCNVCSKVVTPQGILTHYENPVTSNAARLHQWCHLGSLQRTAACRQHSYVNKCHVLG
uniref:Ataxin-7-like protein 1 n=1 Tax=Poecilia reticulata TaxID=8081 RepID=A0A3P9P5X4_POERE